MQERGGSAGLRAIRRESSCVRATQALGLLEIEQRGTQIQEIGPDGRLFITMAISTSIALVGEINPRLPPPEDLGDR